MKRTTHNGAHPETQRKRKKSPQYQKIYIFTRRNAIFLPTNQLREEGGQCILRGLRKLTGNHEKRGSWEPPLAEPPLRPCAPVTKHTSPRTHTIRGQWNNLHLSRRDATHYPRVAGRNWIVTILLQIFLCGINMQCDSSGKQRERERKRDSKRDISKSLQASTPLFNLLAPSPPTISLSICALLIERW